LKVKTKPLERSMEEEQIREALNAHWHSSAVGDANAEHDIYDDDAICDYPQSGERIFGQSNLQAFYSSRSSYREMMPLHEFAMSSTITMLKANMDAVTIRQATLADLPLLLQYRRAMTEEMAGADEVAVNRMVAALETYLRAAILEGRWHSWVAEPGDADPLKSCSGFREGWTQRRDGHGYTAFMSSPRFAVVVLDAG
jgi:hypothetical protein